MIMQNIKAIIIDDESDAIESLQFELEHYCPGVEVVKSYQSPMKALEEYSYWECDVLFLDIEMPVMSGFDFLEKLGKLPFHVVFVTAYDQFAIKAFEFNAFDYLLKPVQKNKLIRVVEKIRNYREKSIDRVNVEAAITNIQSQSNPLAENIALPTTEGFVFVKINNILYVQAESNYSWVHTEDGRKFLLSKTLKSIEEMIGSPKFLRVHQSYCINLPKVSKYVRGQGGYLVLNEGTQIPVSRSKKEDLMSILSSGF